MKIRIVERDGHLIIEGKENKRKWCYPRILATHPVCALDATIASARRMCKTQGHQLTSVCGIPHGAKHRS